MKMMKKKKLKNINEYKWGQSIIKSKNNLKDFPETKNLLPLTTSCNMMA